MSLGNILGTMRHEAPFFSILLAAEFVALSLATVVLALTNRQLKRANKLRRAALLGNWGQVVTAGTASRLLEFCGTIPSLLVIAATVFATQKSRGLILQGVAHTDLGAKATMLSQGLLGELTSIPIGLLSAVLPAVLGCIAVAWAASARLQMEGILRGAELAVRDPAAATAWATQPGPRPKVLAAVGLAFVFLGLTPIGWAAFRGTLLKFERFVALAELDPGLKVTSFEEAERDARALLDQGFLLAAVGVVVAAVFAAVVLWTTSPPRARRRLLGRGASEPGSRETINTGIVALGSACVLFVVARPMKIENEMHWPQGSVNKAFGAETPQLDGPDAIERGPVLEVTPERLSVDRAQEDLKGIEDRLRVHRRNFALLHPGEIFPATVVLLCAPDVPAPRALEVLRAASRAGYSHATFVFEKRVEVVRPILGRIPMHHVTGAHVALVDTAHAATPETVQVRASDAQTCGGISERITHARQLNRSVTLFVHDAGGTHPLP